MVNFANLPAFISVRYKISDWNLITEKNSLILINRYKQLIISNLKTKHMSKKTNQHVTKHAEGWQVKGAGNSKATVVVKTQAEAIKIGREIAKNQGSELLIHNSKGQISKKDSGGNDPRNIKG